MLQKNRWWILALGFLLLGTGLRAQGNSGPAILAHFGYGPQIPFGDLSDRFGQNFATEVSLEYLLNSNWTFGIQSHFMFGSNVEVDPLTNLRTSGGFIIGNDRDPAEIQLRQRGSYYGVRVGKLIGLAPNNDRSGLRLAFGIGLLQHRIRIQEDPLRDVSQLTGDYVKGYDRLTNGLALHQFVGYQVLSKTNGIHVVAGFEFFQGFTQSRRSFDFDLQRADTTQRLDGLIGFRLNFTLPFYLGNAEDVFY